MSLTCYSFVIFFILHLIRQPTLSEILTKSTKKGINRPWLFVQLVEKRMTMRVGRAWSVEKNSSPLASRLVHPWTCPGRSIALLTRACQKTVGVRSSEWSKRGFILVCSLELPLSVRCMKSGGRSILPLACSRCYLFSVKY